MDMEVISGQIVRQQLDNLKPTKLSYLSTNNQQIKDKINELVSIRNDVIDREQEFYGLFNGNIKDINALNNYIQKEIGDLLIFNNNTILDRLKLTDQNMDFSAFLEKLTPIVETSLAYVLKNKNLATDAEVEAAMRDVVISIFNKNLEANNSKGGSKVVYKFIKSSSKGKSLGRVLANFVVKNGKLDLKDKLDQYVSSATKSRLKNILNLQGNIKTNGESGVTVQVYNKLAQENRQSFATWGNTQGLTQKEKETMRDSLLQQLLSYLSSAKSKEAFKKAFYKIPLDSWFVNTKTAVAGILGEVQLGAILEVIFKNPNVIQVGDLRNEAYQNRKVSIDTILNSCGFQVKNYNLYADILNLKSDMKYFTINESGSIQKIAKRLDLDGVITDTLNHFFAIDSFNVQYDEKFSGIRQRIDTTKEQYGNFLGGLGANKFLKFSQEIKGSIGETYLNRATYYNVFYYSNGKFFASSQILNEIIKVLNNLLRAEPSNIILQTSYSGITSATEKDKVNIRRITSEEISKNINLNIHYMFTM